MRRIYESDALHRDAHDPFAPSQRAAAARPQAARSINSTAVSRLLIPLRLRYRAISVRLTTPQSAYPVGSSVPFTLTMKNSMPFPISVPTRTPLLWTWAVDGSVEAARVPVHDPPDERGELTFNRGERKQFTKRWNGMFRVSDSEWYPAPPGRYSIGVEINVDDAASKGLSDETTVQLVAD